MNKEGSAKILDMLSMGWGAMARWQRAERRNLHTQLVRPHTYNKFKYGRISWALLFYKAESFKAMSRCFAEISMLRLWLLRSLSPIFIP